MESFEIIDCVVKFVITHPDARAPLKATPGSAGFDLFPLREVIVPVGGRALVPLGLRLEMPKGTYGRIAPRSGLAVDHGIHVGAGVIDPDYRGELSVLIFNLGNEMFMANRYRAIAQLIFEEYRVINIVGVETVTETLRGTKGFGSTDLVPLPQ